MRWLVLLLLLPVAGADTWNDPADDQANAPAYKAWDVATMRLQGVDDDAYGGTGLWWSIGFHPGHARAAPPHPEGQHVTASATLGNVSTTTTAGTVCASFPPACFQGLEQAADFGPDNCVFTDIYVELRDGDLIDRVPDAGGLTYDACHVFGVAPATRQVVDACGDQDGSPQWSHGDLRWLNATINQDGQTWLALRGNIRDCEQAPGDPTHEQTAFVYHYTLNGEAMTLDPAICESLPVGCIDGDIQLTADACLVTGIVLESVRDDGTTIDRIPDWGGFSISGCHLFEEPEPIPAASNTTTTPAPVTGNGSSADGEHAPAPMLWLALGVAVVLARRT